MIRGYLFNGLRPATELWLRLCTDLLRSCKAAREWPFSNGDALTKTISQSYRLWLWRVSAELDDRCRYAPRGRGCAIVLCLKSDGGNGGSVALSHAPSMR
jgi:hypothetical protein